MPKRMRCNQRESSFWGRRFGTALNLRLLALSELPCIDSPLIRGRNESPPSLHLRVRMHDCLLCRSYPLRGSYEKRINLRVYGSFFSLVAASACSNGVPIVQVRRQETERQARLRHIAAIDSKARAGYGSSSRDGGVAVRSKGMSSPRGRRGLEEQKRRIQRSAPRIRVEPDRRA